MSKHNHNYTQYSNKPKTETAVGEVKMDSVPETNSGIIADQPVVRFNAPKTSDITQETPKVIDTPNVMQPKPQLVKETAKTKPVPETVTGMVVGCSKLNVRAEADLFANIVCVLDNRSEIAIDVNKSNKDWFYVCTATGVEGYCMRKYVEAHL